MNEHKPEPWVNDLKMYFLSEAQTVTNINGEAFLAMRYIKIEDFIRTLLASQNTANAERIRGLIQIGKGGHGECCMCTDCKNWHEDCTCAENRIAEAAARLIEKD